MAIKPKPSTGGTDFELVEAGTYLARCVSMIHLGTIPETFKGEDKEMDKVFIQWELPTETFETDGGETKCRIIGKEFTLSMYSQARLRSYLESWRGAAFTDAQADDFDVTVLIGQPCQISVIHKTSQKGNVYTDISAITPMMKGTKAPDQVNDSFEFSYTPFSEEAFNKVPEWLRKKIVTSAEYQAQLTAAVGKPQSANETPAQEIIESEDPPF
ncbi:MAG: phage replication initiation protein, NGO0469 family [Nitrosomonadaceae bacterium]